MINNLITTTNQQSLTERVGGRPHEPVDGGLPSSTPHIPIDALARVSTQNHEILQHVQHHSELAENQHFPTLLPELGQ